MISYQYIWRAGLVNSTGNSTSLNSSYRCGGVTLPPSPKRRCLLLVYNFCSMRRARQVIARVRRSAQGAECSSTRFAIETRLNFVQRFYFRSDQCHPYHNYVRSY